jgi:hypothetical protein
MGERDGLIWNRLGTTSSSYGHSKESSNYIRSGNNYLGLGRLLGSQEGLHNIKLVKT